MKGCLFNVKLAYIPPHNTRYDCDYAPTSNPVLAKKWYPGLMAYCML